MTYWLEFFESFPRGEAPDVVYIPIGMGSGFCAAAAARAFTGARSRLVGVVSAHATTYLDSFRVGRVVASTLQPAAMAAARINRVSGRAFTRWIYPGVSLRRRS